MNLCIMIDTAYKLGASNSRESARASSRRVRFLLSASIKAGGEFAGNDNFRAEFQGKIAGERRDARRQGEMEFARIREYARARARYSLMQIAEDR